MKVISRNIKESIEKDFQQKFVFLSGSRQVGKTTLQYFGTFYNKANNYLLDIFNVLIY